MEEKKILAFLIEAVYLDTIQVIKTANTTSIFDAVTNVEFSLTKSDIYKNKYHSYFIDNEDKCWHTIPLNRGIFARRDFDITTLPNDWDEQDMLVMNENISIGTDVDTILNLAMNYFLKYVDIQKSIQNGAYIHLENN